MPNLADPRSAPRARLSRRPASYPLLDAGALAMLLILSGAFLAPALAWIALAPAPDIALTMPIELIMLDRAALLSLLLPVVQIAMQIRRDGGSAVRGNREFPPRPGGMIGRLSRAHANGVESLVAFASVVLVAHAMAVTNRWTVAAASLYLAARVVHALSYAAGLTIIRSAAFYAGWLATITIAVVAL